MQGKHLEVEMQLPGSVFLKRFVVFGHSRNGGCAEKKNSHPAFDVDDGNWKVISIHFRFRIKIVMLTLHVCCFVTGSEKGLTITPLYCLQTFYTECWSNKCSTAPPWTADIESEKKCTTLIYITCVVLTGWSSFSLFSSDLCFCLRISSFTGPCVGGVE